MKLTIRKGTPADVEALIRFLDAVRADMLRKDWFYLDPPDLVREMLSGGVMELWLAMDGDRMAASFDILYPGLASCNYGYDLGLSREELLRVIHMDTAAVHRDYRGLGLQRRLLERIEQELAGQGRRILLCTVHPENSYSLNNMLKQGYRIEKHVEKYGSERFILRKEIF